MVLTPTYHETTVHTEIKETHLFQELIVLSEEIVASHLMESNWLMEDEPPEQS